jgi:hypothetical protein
LDVSFSFFFPQNVRNPSAFSATTASMSTNHNTLNSTTSYEKIASACTGAILTSLLVTPMDVVKMRLQTQAMNAAYYNKTSKALYNSCCMPADLKQVAGEVCKWNTMPRHERKRMPAAKLRAAAMHECSHGTLRLDAALRASRPTGILVRLSAALLLFSRVQTNSLILLC